jgi:hypothetical protein
MLSVPGLVRRPGPVLVHCWGWFPDHASKKWSQLFSVAYHSRQVMPSLLQGMMANCVEGCFREYSHKIPSLRADLQESLRQLNRQ